VGLRDLSFPIDIRCTPLSARKPSGERTAIEERQRQATNIPHLYRTIGHQIMLDDDAVAAKISQIQLDADMMACQVQQIMLDEEICSKN
jgi:hypothetical protein